MEIFSATKKAKRTFRTKWTHIHIAIRKKQEQKMANLALKWCTMNEKRKYGHGIGRAHRNIVLTARLNVSSWCRPWIYFKIVTRIWQKSNCTKCCIWIYTRLYTNHSQHSHFDIDVDEREREKKSWCSFVIEIVHSVNNTMWWTWWHKYSLKHYLNFSSYFLLLPPYNAMNKRIFLHQFRIVAYSLFLLLFPSSASVSPVS